MIMEKKTIFIVLAAILLVAGGILSFLSVRERCANRILESNLEALIECEIISTFGNSFIVTKVSPCEYKCDAGGSEGCPLFW